MSEQLGSDPRGPYRVIEVDCSQWCPEVPAAPDSESSKVSELPVKRRFIDIDCAPWNTSTVAPDGNQEPGFIRFASRLRRLPRKSLIIASVAAVVVVALSVLIFGPGGGGLWQKDPAREYLFHNLAAGDKENLRSADESTIVRIALTCESIEVRQLAERYKNDPKTLLELIQKELRK